MSKQPALLANIDAAFAGDDIPQTLGVAVSGGSDSLGLLFLLRDWARSTLCVATVDHGLRPESGTEADHVADLCAKRGVAHSRLVWTGWNGHGNLQDQARRARYRLLSDWAASHDIADIALGHTLDDQAETFLLGLSRGAGLDGLSGMRPVFERNGIRFHRPFLAVRRQTLRDYLDKLNVRWIDDPSNANDRFDRVRARKALSALSPLGIDADSLGHSIANLRDTRASIGTYLADWAEQNTSVDHGDLCLAVDPFLALPQDFARRILNSALRWVSGADYPPRAASVLNLLNRNEGQATTLHGCFIDFRGSALRIGREPEAAMRADKVPTEHIWDSRWVLDGPHEPELEIRALGSIGLRDCPDWRATGLPRATLKASPAVWRGDTLVSAPIAGYGNGWQAKLCPGHDDFAATLIRR